MRPSAGTSVFLSLGSNLGDREKLLRQAVRALPAAGVPVVRESSIYLTEPVDFVDQPWFLNCVVEAETALAPLELLARLRGIEARLGSKKEFPKGPRLLDIDVLLYGLETIETPDLEVPHPRMTERRFVLAPLAELAPGLRHPNWAATAEELLARLPKSGAVRLYSAAR